MSRHESNFNDNHPGLVGKPKGPSTPLPGGSYPPGAAASAPLYKSGDSVKQPRSTPAEQLYALPEEIQVQLVRIAREAMGMSADEKGYAAAIFGTVAHHFAQRDLTDDNEPFISGALMVGALGVLVKYAHLESMTTKENV